MTDTDRDTDPDHRVTVRRALAEVCTVPVLLVDYMLLWHYAAANFLTLMCVVSRNFMSITARRHASGLYVVVMCHPNVNAQCDKPATELS